LATTKYPPNLIQKAWALDLWKEVMNEIYFKKFMSEGSDSVITKKTDLKTKAGDSIVIPLLMKLQGSGTAGDSTLEGNEEALTYFDMAVSVAQKRHAVRSEGAQEEQKSQLNFRTNAKSALKIWMSEMIDDSIFAALCSNPSPNRLLLPTGCSAISDITSSNKLTTTMIRLAKLRAKMASPKIRPIKVDGKDHYIMLVNPYAADDLKQDSTWLQAQREAGIRGKENPIFSGALGVYDGVILHDHESVPLAAEGSSGAQVSYNVLLGAQAGAYAIAKEPFWKEKKFDYDNQQGVATGLIYGVRKSVFNGEDFGLITCPTSAAVR
jgi:N4-gp56 family major capsid protein